MDCFGESIHTNNDTEGYHRRLKGRAKQSTHSSLSTYTLAVQRSQERTYPGVAGQGREAVTLPMTQISFLARLHLQFMKKV